MTIRSRIFRSFILPAFAIAAQVAGGSTGVAMPAPQQEIGFSEEFALSDDRDKVLENLVPGTEQFYYFHSLQALHKGEFDQVDELLKQWSNRLGESAQYRIIRNRLYILRYDSDPDGTLEYLKDSLSVNLNHQRRIPETQRNLPTSLDVSLIDQEALLKKALSRSNNLNRIEDPLLEKLATERLSKEQLRAMLSRITYPDFPQLVELIAKDLKTRETVDFGSIGIHNLLTLQQLDQLQGLVPALKDHNQFVNTRLSRLVPSNDTDIRTDRQANGEFLERLKQAVMPLAPKFNSLKACVLYRILEFQRMEEKYDRELFLEYLKLPRNVAYINAGYLRTFTRPDHIVQMGTDYQSVIKLVPVYDDSGLVAEFLQHFLLDANNDRAFRRYVDSDFLNQQIAIARILNGNGDPDKLAGMLSPSEYQALVDRVDLDFARTNREFYSVDDAVEVELYTKNVSNLLVKVYEINTHNFYRKNRREIDTDINLDGLVANREMTFQYDDAAAIRMKRKFEFPGIDHAGVFVVDFIGGGKSSRALIRKGRLSLIEQTTVVGHVLNVVDQDDELVKDAWLWIDGRRYDPQEDGRFLVPFTDSPRLQMAIINSGEFSCYEGFQHKREQYSLNVAMMLDREALRRSQRTGILLRPMLSVAGLPAGVSRLENATLTISSVDQSGNPSKKTFRDLELGIDAETICEFVVPPALASIGAEFTAEVKNLSSATTETLTVTNNWTVNQIDRTDEIRDLHLAQHADGYTLEILGKSGEARPAQAVRVEVKVVGIKQPVIFDLQSDEQGQVQLGKLPAVHWIQANLTAGTQRQWSIVANRQTTESIVHAAVGQLIEIPVPETTLQGRELVSLFELRHGKFVADKFDQIKIGNDTVEIEGLVAGDYQLRFKPAGNAIIIRVTEGKPIGNLIRGQNRNLEIRTALPVHIDSIESGDEELAIRIGNPNPWTRVHIVGTRYMPRFTAFNQLGSIRDVTPSMQQMPLRRSVYLAGRSIGDEYQYILDRQKRKKYPGNMLERPGLLISPWALRETTNNSENLSSGDDYGKVGNSPQEPQSERLSRSQMLEQQSDFSNLDFLLDSSLVAVNLRADEEGVIRIAREKLGSSQHFRVILVDAYSTAVRDVKFPLPERSVRDLSMAIAMKPDGHFSQVREIEVLNDGEKLVIEDVASSGFQYFEDLSGAWRLLNSVGRNAGTEFDFVLQWPGLEEEKQHELYSKYACHELNFFLSRKDPEFFRSVVRPHIVNKKDKTFMDHYLLGNDLSGYRRPWKFEKLNTVEKILLGRQLEEQTLNISRSIEERYLLNPTSRGEFGKRFDISIASSYLDDISEDEKRDSELRLLSESNSYDLPPGADASEEDRSGGRGFGGGGMGGGGRGRQSDGIVNGDRLGLLKKSDGVPPIQQGQMPHDALRFESRTRTDENGNVTDYTVPVPYTENGPVGGEWGGAIPEALYRPVEVTREWIENNYWHLTPDQTTETRVQPNRFWRDFAAHQEGPFLSPWFAEADGNLTEMMFAISVLDLPFEAAEHEFQYADDGMTMDAKGPVIVLHQQVRPAPFNPENTTILVSENFFQKNDRFKFEDGLKYDKFVTGEFYAHTLYGGQVVITNPTSTPRPIDLLIQVPKGAVVASGSRETRSLPLDLGAFSTQTFEYFFYFPTAGEFTHFPAHVSSDERVLAAANVAEINVVDRPASVDESSWEYVSQNGTDDEVLRFLNLNNIQRLDLGQIAFRMKDKDFFLRAIETLTNRYAFDKTLWAYSIEHNDTESLREYLKHADGLTGRLGSAFQSDLVTIDPVERKIYDHREYTPLINARTHRVGQKRKILNPFFHRQYHSMLDILCHRKDLSVEDHLAVTYYLLLQDRVEEAIGHFAKSERDGNEIQYDYCGAYLDFYMEKPADAAAKAEPWKDYPVLLWQNRFRTIIAQAEEIQTGISTLIDEENTRQRQEQLASESGSFDFEIEAGKINIDYQNLTSATINFYEMDVELLFSRSPFDRDQQGGFSMILPNQSLELALDAEGKTAETEVPDEFQNKNVLVEITSGDQSRSHSYFENTLNLQMIEKFGQLRLTDRESGTPLSTAYVKVYARDASGTVRFHKDGYTDLRGRFDYVTQSNNAIDNQVQYAILVMHEEKGATIRLASPPSR